MRRATVLAWGGAGLGALGLALFIGWWRVDGPGAPEPQALRPAALTDMTFRLIDHEGRHVGPGTLIGRPAMVFFGFTYCPDICPTTLSEISGWLDELGAAGEGIQAVFITVDPTRDTVDAMAGYVGAFHPSISGLTGTEAEIARAAEGFRVRYEQVPTEGGDYTMNHTAGVFLYDAAGRFVSIVDPHEPRDVALPKIRRALDAAASGS
ncbi:MAG: SCO family protein [Pikeienuella sp.]|uniref:SCO family protein n=1 Tax=Pikeienuella sp. TaxID=2831957 RepID=UPI00391C6636